MGFPLIPLGLHMGFTMYSHGFPMDFPWNDQGCPMGSPWNAYGVPMECPWVPMGPMHPPWNSHGCHTTTLHPPRFWKFPLPIGSQLILHFISGQGVSLALWVVEESIIVFGNGQVGNSVNTPKLKIIVVVICDPEVIKLL